jgi:DNA-binding MarR family transcriptional regulator
MEHMAERDEIDERIDTWVSGIPDLDLEVEGIVERIQLLEKRIRRMLEETLAEFGVNTGEWGVLGMLHYAGPAHRRSPGQLAKWCRLTTGAMTNRLDRLEAEGLVRRLPDPDDRRGVIVELTDKGKELWERGVGAQAVKEQFVADALNATERRQLNTLLRRLVLRTAQKPTAAP